MFNLLYISNFKHLRGESQRKISNKKEKETPSGISFHSFIKNPSIKQD